MPTFNGVRLFIAYARAIEADAPGEILLKASKRKGFSTDVRSAAALEYLYVVRDDARDAPPSRARDAAIAAQLLRAHDVAPLVGYVSTSLNWVLP